MAWIAYCWSPKWHPLAKDVVSQSHRCPMRQRGNMIKMFAETSGSVVMMARLVFLSKEEIIMNTGTWSFSFNKNNGFYLGVLIHLAREQSLRLVFQTMNAYESALMKWCHTRKLINVAKYMTVKILHFIFIFIILFILDQSRLILSFFPFYKFKALFDISETF